MPPTIAGRSLDGSGGGAADDSEPLPKRLFTTLHHQGKNIKQIVFCGDAPAALVSGAAYSTSSALLTLLNK